MDVTSDDILKEYRKLMRIRRTPEWLYFFFGSKSDHHYDQYTNLQSLVLSNQDQLYELIFSGKVTEEQELRDLIFFGGHGGSVAKKDNRHWAPFIARVRERQNELPPIIQSHLNWLKQVHGY